VAPINTPQSRSAIKEVAQAAYAIDLLSARLGSILVGQSISDGSVDIQTAINDSTPESGLMNISSQEVNDFIAAVGQLSANNHTIILKLAALR